ncbi:hypothetical protein PLESTF_001017500 [Pleodorina starrii]|nr:hypothetical protein PLESTM_001093100 [Pleodorina starrii]GLC70644.1 hypothetical protein PLESTF_001017500 [Pleodorina starrii]
MTRYEAAAAAGGSHAAPREAVNGGIDDAGKRLEDMTRGGDLELVFRGGAGPAGAGSGDGVQGGDRGEGGSLRVHSAILRMTSGVLDAMLGEMLQCTAGGASSGPTDDDGAPRLQLCLDDDPREWRRILPMLYPRMHTPLLTWEDVRLVLNIAHKYDMPLVLKPCERFLLSEEAAPLSCDRSDPNYVLDWLEISERLHLDDLRARCLRYIRSGYTADVAAAGGGCHYCAAVTAASAAAAAGAGGTDVVLLHRLLSSQRHVACACVCPRCGGRRKYCGCAYGSSASSSAGAAAAAGAASRSAAATRLQPLLLTSRHQQGPRVRGVSDGSDAAAALAARMEAAMLPRNGAGRYGGSFGLPSAGCAYAVASDALRGGLDRPAAFTFPRSALYGPNAPAAAAVAGGTGGGASGSSGSVPARSVVLRDREGLSRLSVRSLVDLLVPDE